MSPLINAASFLINVFFNAFLGLLLLRFIFQLVKIDFYNPISQFIVKITNPLLVPMRRIIPGIAGIDMASLVLLLLVQSIEIVALILLKGIDPQFDAGFFLGISLWGTGELIKIVLDLYTFGTFILVIFSWLPTQGYNPILALLTQVINPAMAPIRRIIKPIAGLDLSPFFFIIILQLIAFLCAHPLISYGKFIMIS